MSDPVDPNDLDVPPSEEEAAEAEALRRALDDRSNANADAELARALSASWSPRDLAAEEHRRIVAKALAERRGRVLRVSFGASAFVALAASVLLFLWTTGRPPVAGSAPAWVAASRSTQALFTSAFPSRGGETTRVDRIAMARGADLRDNEFAKWGLR